MRGTSLVESDDDDFAPPTPHNIRLVESLSSNNNDHDTPLTKRSRSAPSNDSIRRMSKKSRVDRPPLSKTTTTSTITLSNTKATRITAKADSPSTSSQPRPPPPTISTVRRPVPPPDGQQQQQPATRFSQKQEKLYTERVIVLDSASEEDELEVPTTQPAAGTTTLGEDAVGPMHSPILPPEEGDICWTASDFGGASSQIQRQSPGHQSGSMSQPNLGRYTQDTIASSQGSQDGDNEDFQCPQQQPPPQYYTHHEGEAEEVALSWSLSPSPSHHHQSHNTLHSNAAEQGSTMLATCTHTRSSMDSAAQLYDHTTEDHSFQHVANSDTEEMLSRSTTVVNECILCGKSLAHLDAARVEYHLNTCLDEQQQQASQQIGSSTSDNKGKSTIAAREKEPSSLQDQDSEEESAYPPDIEQFSSSQRVYAGANVDFLTVLTKCPICKSNWQQQRASSSLPLSSSGSGKAKALGKPLKARRKVEHMKRCAKNHHQSAQTLLYQIRLLKEKHERAVLLGTSKIDDDEDPSNLSQEMAASYQELSIHSGIRDTLTSIAASTAATPHASGDNNVGGLAGDEDSESPLIDRRREKCPATPSPPLPPPKRTRKPKLDLVRKQVVSMTETPDDNFMSDAIVTSVQVQQRQLTAANNSIARAERLEQMHLDQEDEALQMALVMSLSEVESCGGSVDRGVGEATSSPSSTAQKGERRRRRRPGLDDHETSVLPIEEVKVLIQEKVFSLLFPENVPGPLETENSGGDNARVSNNNTSATPPWRPSRFQEANTGNASQSVDGDKDDMDQDSLVESFSQLSSDIKPQSLSMPQAPRSSLSLWRLSQIGTNPDVQPMDLTKHQSPSAAEVTATDRLAVDQDVFLTEFMRRYLHAARERTAALAQDQVNEEEDSYQENTRVDKEMGERLSREIQACLDEMTLAVQLAKQKAFNKVIALLKAAQSSSSNPFTTSALPHQHKAIAAENTRHRKYTPPSSPNLSTPPPPAALSLEDEIVLPDIEYIPSSPSMRYSRPPSDANESFSSLRRLSDRLSIASRASLQRFSNITARDTAVDTIDEEEGVVPPPYIIPDGDGDDVHVDPSSSFMHCSPPLEHSPIVGSPMQSPEPAPAEELIGVPASSSDGSRGQSSTDAIVLISPPLRSSSSQQRRRWQQQQPKDSQTSSTIAFEADDDQRDHSLPPPLDLHQLLGFPLSQPALRSAPMVVEDADPYSQQDDFSHNRDNIDFVSDPRRLSFIQEDVEDEEQRRRSLSAALGLAAHIRGRSRSEEPPSSSVLSSGSVQAPLHTLLRRRQNPLAGLPLLPRHRPPPPSQVPSSLRAIETASSQVSSSPSSPLLPENLDVISVRQSTLPSLSLSQQPSSSAPVHPPLQSRTFGRSASTTRLPTATSSVSTISTQNAANPRTPGALRTPQTPPSGNHTGSQQLARTPSSRGYWGGHRPRFVRSGGMAPITTASRERAGNLVAESARIMAAFASSQPVAADESENTGNAGYSSSQPQQPMSSSVVPSQGDAQEQQQRPDFEHMSLPRLRLAAISFGLRVTTKRKMIDDLCAIWDRMHAPSSPASQAQAVTIATEVENSTLCDNTFSEVNVNGGSSSSGTGRGTRQSQRQQGQRQQCGQATSLRDDDEEGEEDQDFVQESRGAMAASEDQGLMSPFVSRRQDPLPLSPQPQNRSGSDVNTPASLPSTSGTTRVRLAGRRGGHSTPIVQRDESEQDDHNISTMGEIEDEDDDDEEMIVLSPRDPDRLRMSMEDIIMSEPDGIPHGSSDAHRKGPLSSSSSSSASNSSVLPSDLDKQLFRFVMSNPHLHHQCLTYKPLDLEDLWEQCDKAGIQVTRQHLRLFLDRRGITCFIPAHSPLNSWRKTHQKQTSRQQKQPQTRKRTSKQSSNMTSRQQRQRRVAGSVRQQPEASSSRQAVDQEMEDEDEDDRVLQSQQPRPRPLARKATK